MIFPIISKLFFLFFCKLFFLFNFSFFSLFFLLFLSNKFKLCSSNGRNHTHQTHFTNITFIWYDWNRWINISVISGLEKKWKGKNQNYHSHVHWMNPSAECIECSTTVAKHQHQQTCNTFGSSKNLIFSEKIKSTWSIVLTSNLHCTVTIIIHDAHKPTWTSIETPIAMKIPGEPFNAFHYNSMKYKL